MPATVRIFFSSVRSMSCHCQLRCLKNQFAPTKKWKKLHCCSILCHTKIIFLDLMLIFNLFWLFSCTYNEFFRQTSHCTYIGTYFAHSLPLTLQDKMPQCTKVLSDVYLFVDCTLSSLLSLCFYFLSLFFCANECYCTSSALINLQPHYCLFDCIYYHT